MSIMTMELRGLGTASEMEAAVARAVSPWRQGQPLNVLSTVTPSFDAAPSASSLLAQYGPTVGAGLAGLIVGLVLAKVARRRKKS